MVHVRVVNSAVVGVYIRTCNVSAADRELKKNIIRVSKHYYVHVYLTRAVFTKKKIKYSLLIYQFLYFIFL